MKLIRSSPILPVRNMAASVSIYGKLGFSVEHRDDGWGWAMFRLDECRLRVDQSINLHPAAPRQSVVCLYPENIVDYHQQVRRNGLAVPRPGGHLLRHDGISPRGSRRQPPVDRA